MYPNNIYVEDQALEAQMWMQQGADSRTEQCVSDKTGRLLDIDEKFEPTTNWVPTTSNGCAPIFPFNSFPYVASNPEGADHIPATSSITPDTALFDTTLLFTPQEDGLTIPSNVVFSEQLPFYDGLYSGAHVTSKIPAACEDWDKFFDSLTYINGASQCSSRKLLNSELVTSLVIGCAPTASYMAGTSEGPSANSRCLLSCPHPVVLSILCFCRTQNCPLRSLHYPHSWFASSLTTACCPKLLRSCSINPSGARECHKHAKNMQDNCIGCNQHLQTRKKEVYQQDPSKFCKLRSAKELQVGDIGTGFAGWLAPLAFSKRLFGFCHARQ
ncbi:hypothetical protein K438DRAFT_2127804 [Mycena galopus ATCC 62051]|nr:hypothetical protein K438DRAFT_2127804 [Mycena galopus ATCC 62051]